MTASPQRQTALITGASFGIGREFAKLFAADRYDLAIVARTRDKLDELKAEMESAHGVNVHGVVDDLSEPEAPKRIYDALEKAGVRVDVLVNNAGFGGFGFFHETELQHELNMIQVNISALVHLSKVFVRDMVARGNGYIINVSSTAAFQAGPTQSIYYATKAFVLSFSEAIDNELEGTGVGATAFCPGPTLTEFHARAGTETSFKSLRQMSAEEAARCGYEGFKKRKRLVFAGKKNQLLAFGTRLVPRAFSASVARKLQETS